MNDYYIGYIEYIHEHLWGRIKPLAVLKKRSGDGNWAVDRTCEPQEFEPTGLVYWRKIPAEQGNWMGRYVRLKLKQNSRPPKPGGDQDQYEVVGDGQPGHSDRLASIGVRVLPDSLVIGPDRRLAQSSGLGLSAYVIRNRNKVISYHDDIVYRRRDGDTVVDGPWKIIDLAVGEALCLQPYRDDVVSEFEIDDFEPEDLLAWEDKYNRTHLVVLAEPPGSRGRAIDLMPTSGLAGWLVRKLKSDGSLLASLDSALPGWRNQARDLLTDATEPTRRSLELDRFTRLESALEALAADEARLSDLAESPRFREIRDAAIDRELASRVEEIRAEAAEQTRAFVAQERQKREQEAAIRGREKKAFNGELERVRAEIADAQRLRDEVRAQAEHDESTIRAAAEHLVEERERIIRDFAAFHGLIEATRANAGGSVNGHHLAESMPLEVSAPTRAEVVIEGPAIDDQGTFLSDRLTPSLAAWGAEAGRLQAKKLHAALLACRWVATPCPSWGVAYVEAMGGDARHRVVAVEPTWLSFADAWAGEVEAFWRGALEASDSLHLLILADADRALLQCWGRSLLDVVSGLRPTLPSG